MNDTSHETTLEWRSAVATHRERLFAAPTPNTPIATGEGIVTFPRHQFITQQRQLNIEPRVGRFYPQGYAWEALDCSRGEFRPFRLIGATADTFTADLNHPLAHYPLNVMLNDSVVAQGPGMQVPYPGVATDYYSNYPFTRADDRDDTQFYAAPRFVNHLDNTAIAQVTALYGRLLAPGMDILDLMSSHVSHLPDTLDVNVTGLGMNQAELAANPRLQHKVVHDLNQDPVLPFADNRFDAVICTVSVEYLTQPLAVMQELARVTKAGGSIIMTFSTRWFPPKVIALWTEIHPFERQGLVLDYFLQTARFTDLHTESIRGLPRPADDPHRRTTPLSDPVFAVWGTVISG